MWTFSTRSSIVTWGLGMGLVLVGGLPGRADDTVSGILTIDTGATLPILRFAGIDSGGVRNPLWDMSVTTALDTFNANDLTLTDRGTGFIPFTVEEGTPTNMLYLNSLGQVGIGTAAPVTALHVKPPFLFSRTNVALRLESQNGVSPNTPQAWDLVSRASRFTLEDFGDPSAFDPLLIPFTVETDTPSNTLYLSKTGSIGMGTAEPQKIGNTVATGRLINVRSDTSNSRFVMQGQTGGLMELVDLSAAADRKIFRIFSRSGFTRFQVVTDDLSAFTVNNVLAFDMSNGNVGLRVASPLHPLHLASGARCTAGGVFTNASSREFKQDIQPLTSEQARETVRALQPVGYRYKNEPDEKYCGFIAEDVPDLVATNDRKSLAPMDVVAVLTRVVQDQDKLLQDQDRRLIDERQRNDQQQTSLEQQRKTLDEQQQLIARQQTLLAALSGRMKALELRAGGNADLAP